MKFLLTICFCLFSLIVEAKWYTYFYSGPVKVKSEYYDRINTVPVIINFDEQEEAITVNYEGRLVYYYIIKVEETGRNEVTVTTVLSNGTKAVFVIIEDSVIFVINDYAFIATNIPQYKW